MVDAISTLGARMNGDPAGKPYPNFFPAAQRDFAARLQWSVTPRFENANHEPLVSITGPTDIRVAPGERLHLTGAVSDPDGDVVTLHWLQFRTGTYPGEVAIVNPELLDAEVVVPVDARPGQTIHLVLEASDQGLPALTRYQRVILVVQ